MLVRQNSDPPLNSAANSLPTPVWGAKPQKIPLPPDASNSYQDIDIHNILGVRKTFLGR
jgi:hypothetical protein